MFDNLYTLLYIGIVCCYWLIHKVLSLLFLIYWDLICGMIFIIVKRIIMVVVDFTMLLRVIFNKSVNILFKILKKRIKVIVGPIFNFIYLLFCCTKD